MISYKTCKCCGNDFLTEESFIARTKFVGIQSFAPYKMSSIELRDCSCGTTLARKMNEFALAAA